MCHLECLVVQARHLLCERIGIFRKRTGHQREKISFPLWKESKSLRLNLCQKMIGPTIEGNLNVVLEKRLVASSQTQKQQV